MKEEGGLGYNDEGSSEDFQAVDVPLIPVVESCLFLDTETDTQSWEPSLRCAHFVTRREGTGCQTAATQTLAGPNVQAPVRMAWDQNSL